MPWDEYFLVKDNPVCLQLVYKVINVLASLQLVVPAGSYSTVFQNHSLVDKAMGQRDNLHEHIISSLSVCSLRRQNVNNEDNFCLAYRRVR